MIPFLYESARLIFEQYAKTPQAVCIVFQNKQARFFFQKYYAQLAGKASWSPDIFTLDAFLQRIASLRFPDSLSLIFLLHDIVQETSTDFPSETANENIFNDFAHFYTLGKNLLQDFDLADSCLVDSKQLFGHLFAHESLEAHGLDPEQMSTLNAFRQLFGGSAPAVSKDRLLGLWRMMPEIHSRLCSRLLHNRQAYQGLCIRDLARRADGEGITTDYSRIYIVGFNEIGPGLAKIFGHLQRSNKLTFLWDTDAYYVNDTRQEAGKYARINLSRFPDSPIPPPDNFTSFVKRIDCLGVTLNVAQAQLLPAILNRLDLQAENYPETAIVLPDEQLLFPVLHSLPRDVTKINVTLRYPLRNTPLMGLLTAWLQLQAQINRHENNFQGYDIRLVSKLLQHSMVEVMCGDEAKTCLDTLIARKNADVDPRWLVEERSQSMQLIFNPVRSGEHMFSNLLDILFELFSSLSVNSSSTRIDLEGEYIYLVYTTVKRVQDIMSEGEKALPILALIRVLNVLFEEIRIPFVGDPLEGVQIFSLEQTQNIDFRNVIILSANEGILPRTPSPSGFIPQTLRRIFGLPVRGDAEAHEAWLFYRLLQRAENVFILYNSIPGQGQGELSRFVRQLSSESRHPVGDRLIAQSIVPGERPFISIAKKNEVLYRLGTYCASSGASVRSLSVSAITAYMDCKLRFYFRYIAKVSEPLVVTEEVDPASFGEILHKTLETLYKNPLNKKADAVLEAGDFSHFFQMQDETLLEVFCRHYSIEPATYDRLTGIQRITLEALRRYCSHILEFDKKYTPFRLVELEKARSHKSLIELDGLEGLPQVSLYATIDRIDFKNGVFRVVDYKTGTVKKDLDPSKEPERIEKGRYNKAVFQILFYSWLLSREDTYRGAQLMPAIYNIREAASEEFDPQLRIGEGRNKEILTPQRTREILPWFDQIVRGVLHEMFNPAVPFSQTENKANCAYCPYARICNR